MRIYLVYPPISKEERYSSELGNSGGHQIPLGVFYLAAYLRQYGHQVDVVDGEVQKLTAEDIVRRIIAFEADIVGVSSTTVAFHRSVEVAHALKAANPKIPIVIGGPHVSSNTEHAMHIAEFDYGVLNEGEVTLLELVSCIERGERPEQVLGIAWRRDGKLVVNPHRPPIEDLDSLPFPAYDLIPDISVYNPPPLNYKRIPVANVITSRGCPNLCTFCDRSVFGTKLRQRSAANIAAEIEMLYTMYGIREIAFVDDTFTIGKKRITELFGLLGEKGIRFPWTCMSRINTVNYDVLKFMRDNGVWRIAFGIESGDEEILRVIHKDIKLADVSKVIGWCHTLGIKTSGFFIVGHPGETIETIDKTIRFALSIPLDGIIATINTPIPGSTQYAEADRFGTLDQTNWSLFNYWRPVFVPKGLTPEILLEKHREFYRRVYFRTRIVWQYFLSFFSSGGLRRAGAIIRALPFGLRRKKYPVT
jgi:anaerobic magnesium-protoporphyrin IX monomethyl ester cyclase